MREWTEEVGGKGKRNRENCYLPHLFKTTKIYKLLRDNLILILI